MISIADSAEKKSIKVWCAEVFVIDQHDLQTLISTYGASWTRNEYQVFAGEEDCLELIRQRSDCMGYFQSCLPRSFQSHRCAGILLKASRYGENSSFVFSEMLLL